MVTLSGSLLAVISPVLMAQSTDIPQNVEPLPSTAIVAPANAHSATTEAPSISTTIAPTTDAPFINPAAAQSSTTASEPNNPQNEIVIFGRKDIPEDPLSEVNVESFELTQTFDEALVGPAAATYKKVLPSPIREGIRNFLYNLREPVVFLNYLLQLKPGKAAETVGRFAINSTIGAAGLVDIAKRKPFYLPRRSNGFANTLGYYGVGNGPFLFLPLVGPTTVRDFIGGSLDRLVLPVAVGAPFNSLAYTAPAGILGALDHRVEFDDALKQLHENSPDPYAATRAFYLSRRQAEIDDLRGRKSNKASGMTAPPISVQPFIPPHLAPPAVTAEEPTIEEPEAILQQKTREPEAVE